ncbi:MAG: hypothetical protein ACE5F1_17340 [Planctomycetota bacterium]
MARAKQHFKVMCSIANHAKTTALYEDGEALGNYVKLGILAVERRAAKTGDSFQITVGDARRITGLARADHAWKKLGRVADLSPISLVSLTDDDRIRLVKWPNLAKKQGFAESNDKEPDTSESPNTQSPNTNTKRREETPAPPAHPRALNLLAKERGTPERKRRWLEENLTLIEQEAQASFANGCDRKALNAKIASLVIRWYRSELKNPGGQKPRTRNRVSFMEAGQELVREYEKRHGH